MAKIDLKDTKLDVFVKLSNGNPGALSVLVDWNRRGSDIDPDAMTPILSMLSLDTLEIYGSNIWILFKDRCSEDMVRFVGLLRAWQLGFVSTDQIREAANPNGRMLFDREEVLDKVEARLPRFQKRAELPVFPKRDRSQVVAEPSDENAP